MLMGYSLLPAYQDPNDIDKLDIDWIQPSVNKNAFHYDV